MTEYDYSPEGAARHQQKMDVICRWTHETGRYRPADPFAPTTPAMHVRAIQDVREGERDAWKGERGHGRKKHRSRSMGERESRPTHSRSQSYVQAPPVIPGSIPQLHGQSSAAYHGHRSQPKRSTTMPLPPPVPPVPTRSPPVRSHTTHSNQSYNVYYPPQMARPGEPLMMPQGAVTFLPRPQYIQSPLPSPGYSPRRESKSWLSKLGSIFSSRSPSPPSVVYVQNYESPSPKPTRSKSSKSKGKRRHSERRRSERRYSY
ncbi:hypothetical protein E1B28_009408 [Marasmius oreades]|uniref:Uncharacterized protein n=1 Tax=Marasmius oreades TaxID=181124 RepID=A0A9P7UT53_9AGAR|nr:uncharacterized protein E1B28_009408 [Marasmius oreades]KAG7093123.1 hypothetical protein E1B28_009408 [Marasmius oreades]